MDWNAAIEKNREALKRILAMLVAMAGLGTGAFTSPLRWAEGRSRHAARPDESSDCRVGVIEGAQPPPDASRRPPLKGEVEAAPVLPRHLHRAILRLLRPAESAARRLIIVAARGLAAPPQARNAKSVTLPPPRKAKPPIVRNGVGTGILIPRGFFGPHPQTPPHKGEGDVRLGQYPAADAPSTNAALSPSPLWGSEGRAGQAARPGTVRGGDKSSCRLGFPLFDTLRPPFPPRRAARSGVPRICFPGYRNPFPVAPRLPLSPRDPIDAGRLALRLAALAAALDDLPRQARRFARWKAARDAIGAQDRDARDRRRVRRIWPLRPGRPPGQRPARNARRPVHEIHDILTVVHGLAFWVLQRPDTS